jgi:lysophospholipase L1-like esterase
MSKEPIFGMNSMKTRCLSYWLFLILWIPSLPVAASSVKSPEPPTPTIVFLGDSITEAGGYVADVECWLLAQGREARILNVGLSSESATDLLPAENADHVAKFGFARPMLSARLRRTLELTKPDVLFVCYGMNDGHAMRGQPDALTRYGKALENLRDAALDAGVKEVVFLTPPIHDAGPDAVADDPHERNLVVFSEWLVSKRQDGWKVVDIHGPMRRELDGMRKQNPQFRFQKDGVHPQEEGHWLMAREILSQYFGADLQGLRASPGLFQANGEPIHRLVSQRLKILQSAYLLKIGHSRPGVPGGPDSQSGPTIEEAGEKAKQTGIKIEKLISG